MPSRSRLRSAQLVLLVILLAAASGVGSYVLTHALGTPTAAPTPAVTPPRPLVAASAAPTQPSIPPAAPQPAAAGVARRLASAVSAPSLGGRLLARVVDADTGTVLYDAGGELAAPPASTAKLLTAAALLLVRMPTDRLTTTVLAGSPGTVVLVGGGDPTLTGAAQGREGAYPDAARISDLAAQVVKAHIIVRRVIVDGSLFTGPSVSPAWAPEDVPTSYAAPITAITSDGGRKAPGDATRTTSPDLAAGREFAALLGHPSLPVIRGTAPPGSARLAQVESPPLSELVSQMLQDSDNVIAETLAREVAVAEHGTASFAGAAAAISTVLGRRGVRVGRGMLDGSGLAAGDRVSPMALVAVLRLIAQGSPPQLRAIVGALPVAGWSGTLGGRYLSGTSASASGRVRAKTGTLAGVTSLAGFVHDKDGRLLLFALDADRTPPGATAAAEAALDTAVSVLAACGCS